MRLQSRWVCGSGFLSEVHPPHGAWCLCNTEFIVTTPLSSAAASLLGAAEILAKNLRTRTVLVKGGKFAGVLDVSVGGKRVGGWRRWAGLSLLQWLPVEAACG